MDSGEKTQWIAWGLVAILSAFCVGILAGNFEARSDMQQLCEVTR